MLVAKDKIKNNIGEYIIYMYQIEDMIRACKLDKNTIETNIVSQYKVNNTTLAEIRNWYFGLIDLMNEEKIHKNGHLSIITNKVNEVNDFHLYLLSRHDQNSYLELCNATAPYLTTLRQKQNTQTNDIQTITDTIYGYYLLKLKKQDISDETNEAVLKFSKLMAVLSKKFKEYETGEFKIE